MKFLIIAMMLVTTNAALANAQPPCVMKMPSNRGFILAALLSPKTDSLMKIEGISIVRFSILKSTIKIDYGNNQSMQVEVEQQCDGSMAVSEPL